MVVHFARIGLAMGLMVLTSQLAAGAVPTVEDLAGCKLPNDKAVLPAPGSRLADNGVLFSFATKKYSNPAPGDDGKPLSDDQVFQRVRDGKVADVQYLNNHGGTLWAFSGAIMEVTSATKLSSVSGKELDVPFEFPKTSQNLAGEMQIQEGGVYLLKTVDGHFALLRVLEKRDNALVIQWVYQGSGPPKFDIPVNPERPYGRPVEASDVPPPAPTPAPAPTITTAMPPAPDTGGQALTSPRLASTPPVPNLTERPALGPGDVVEPGVIRLISGGQGTPGLEPSMDTFVNQRKQMIEHRMAIIAAGAETPTQNQRKVQAVEDLTYLHADEPEVADLLVSQITFVNLRPKVKEISPDAMCPCFIQLKKMGKAATDAAIRGIAKLDMDAVGDGRESPEYKAKLMGLLVRRVEGDAMAEMILKQAAAKETDAKKQAAFEAALKQ